MQQRNDFEEATHQQLSMADRQQRLRELAIVFLRLGTFAFGGPAAHIAMMDEEVVERRKWLSREKLLDLLGVTNLIPGPNSTELAIHIGYERAGWLGLITAGACFILPAFLMVWLLAFLYVQYQTTPQLGWLLYGVKPVILAVVAQALWKLSQKALKDRVTWATAIAVAGLSWLGLNEILLLLLAGLAILVLKGWRHLSDRPLWPIPLLLAQVSTRAVAEVPHSWQVFWVFLKIGSVLYGSGYVLLAFLQKELVERLQWLTSQQILDAVAIGQFTPGPVFTTATFVGYLVAGNSGAIAATIGIFLPAFVLVALINPYATRLRRSPLTSALLDGVNAASLGLMAVVTLKLATAAVVDWLTVTLAIASVVAAFKFRVNSTYLVLAGGLIGWIAQNFNLVG
ncbi:MAG TPA: chromate transporter [Leptolyngbyaceae cyanobacterium M33_DOE_097]|uniref:Chromate transporter n=1 Tax=Oscillatoriales cyanobacterium SpSt-418 TaxID=2282169 RepID=A0A7C3KG41_9CYAN|nr:chromate transporter [Leptolyngbyaceae cyanobacterium M33_DOE_097]